MKPNATFSSDSRLYVIVDRAAAGSRDLTEIAQAAVRGGADLLQLRDKQASARALLREARRLLPIARAAKIPLIINDRPDVARAAEADGVHLGQDDLPLKEARAILGPGRLIGISTHTLEQALAADIEQADYLGFGPIYGTPTKPDAPPVGLSLIPELASMVSIPFFCIGGIDATTLPDVLVKGAHGAAVVRAVCGAGDPEAATRHLKDQIAEFLRRIHPAPL